MGDESRPLSFVWCCVTSYKHVIFKYNILNKIIFIDEYFIKTFLHKGLFFVINLK